MKINKELWNEFLNDEVAVNCRTKKDVEEFLKYCKEQKLSDFFIEKSPWGYSERTDYNCKDSFITYQHINACEESDYKVITYQQLITPTAKEECTLKEEKKTYKGWKILKMIDEGELKEGDELVDDWENTEYIIESKYGNPILKFKNNKELDVIFDTLLLRTFTIKEKECMTFDEARKTNKNFKYKDWGFGYLTLLGVLRELDKITEGYSLKEKDKLDYYNNIMNEKAWEIEP